MRKVQSGFTLIELVVVIVILGILAATAAPKFINLTADANIAALEGLAASIKSSNNLVYAKAQVKGVANEEDSAVDIDNDGTDDVTTAYGYPSGSRSTGLAEVLELGGEWTYGNKPDDSEFYITNNRFSTKEGGGNTNNNIQVRSNNCYLTYIPPTSAGGSFTISYTTTGC